MKPSPNLHLPIAGMVAASLLWVASAFGGPQVVISELMANNRSAYPRANGFPQWMELYNTGTNTVPLAGMVVTNVSLGASYRVPATAEPLSPHGFRLVYFDNASAGSELHTGFTLRAAGDSVALLSPTMDTLDSVSFGLQAADYSICRVPAGDSAGTWQLGLPTPGAANLASPLGSQAKIHINEWMAKSPGGDDWLELFNEESLPVSLESLVLSDQKSTPSTNRPIHSLSFLAPEDFLQLFASNLATPAANQLDFKLSAKGASIYLYGPDRTKLLDKVKFGVQADGISEGFLPDGGTNLVTFGTGRATPGASNFRKIPGLLINELLSHTDPPFEDAVELFNAGPVPVDISGYWMSNQRVNPWRFRIPSNTVLAPFSFRVLFESEFRNSNPAFPNFTFNSAHGDQCYITAADVAGALLDSQVSVIFGAAAHGISFGRIPTAATEEFVPMSATSFGMDAPASVAEFEQGGGRSNAPPLVGPLVISEIMYHPLAVVSGDQLLDEYIELQNITGAPVALFNLFTDLQIPSATTNTWALRGAVEFQFPVHMTVPAEGRVVVVGFDPVASPAQAAHFRTRYGVPSNATLLGPWKGSLPQAGAIEVYKPDTLQLPPHPDAGYLPSVLVERVFYSDSGMWPVAANGAGSALQRRALDRFGNDPANWTAATPGPGRAAPPETLEVSLDPGRKLRMVFQAAAGLSYVVLTSSNLPGGAWVPLSPVIPFQAATRTVSWTNSIPAGPGSAFFRVEPAL